MAVAEGQLQRILESARSSDVDIGILIVSELGGKQTGVEGQNLLYAASLGGHWEIVEFLVESGVDMNARHGELGRTALHVAVAGGHMKVVEILVTHHARLDQVSQFAFQNYESGSVLPSHRPVPNISKVYLSLPL